MTYLQPATPALTDPSGYDPILAVFRERPTSKAAVLIVALLPFTRIFGFDFFGQLAFQDIVALLLLPVLLMDRHSMRLDLLRPFFIFLALWLGSQIVTDVIRDTSLTDAMRGNARIVTFGVEVAVLWKLISGRSNLILIYALSLGLSLILGPLVGQFAVEEDHLGWKFDLGLGIAIVTISTISLRSIRSLQSATLLTFGGMLLLSLVFLFNNARSYFGIVFVTACYLLLSMFMRRRPGLSRSVRKRHFLVLMVSGILTSQVIFAGYGVIVQSGMLGDAALKKYEQQTEGDLGLLLGGRTESLVSFVAIADSPIIGHGSWAKGIEYVRLLHKKLRAAGVRTSGSEGTSTLIPSHSYMLGAWVDGGFLGALFWANIILVCFAVLYQTLKIFDIPAPLVVFSAINLLWSTLFSPFGTSARFVTALEVVLLFTVIGTSKRQQLTEQVVATLRKQRMAARPTEAALDGRI